MAKNQNKRHTAAIRTGLRLRKAGRLRDAAGYFRELSREMPDDALVWFYLGVTLDNLAYESRAIPCYHRALRLDDHHPFAYEIFLYLCSSYRKTGRPLAAKKYLALAERFGRRTPLEIRLGRLVERDLAKRLK